MIIKRGDLFLANLEPTKGAEQGRIRPVIIIQNNIFNNYSPTTIVVPITSKIPNKKYLTSVIISKQDSKLKKDSTILTNQIRTIDKGRIIRRLGILNNEIMNKVDLAIKISLGLN
ncbi:MAG: type II toxin-antitoxin system PemK/MazF family toxin [Nanoarchaeota archaeon]|nr:type II toxin-antitoxin system PemK/MazF family toxin [Nanoarchaeota archaeon]